MNQVRRVFVEKKEGFRVEADALLADLKENLQLDALTGVRLVNRYDVEGLSDEEFETAKKLVFSEAPVDTCWEETLSPEAGDWCFATEFLPGQFDARADSAEECISIITQKARPRVRYAKVYLLSGALSEEDLEKVKRYIINPVESREASLEKPASLAEEAAVPDDVATVEGFISKSRGEMEAFARQMGFAMDLDDLLFCQDYFQNVERRDPTVTEMRMIDTYWSDHCRHTTFATRLNEITIPDGKYAQPIRNAYQAYLSAKAEVGNADRDTCLMNIATMAMKKLKKDGVLTKLDESEEINACSIHVDVDVDGKIEKWLLLFKNETHNHPTEIEPFGGAATCLGGAIRDPLSGRAYVYQAMRVTGSGDVRASMAETLPGKLMQRKISKTAAAGYSSYGNQIGLATGQVAEIYHEGYVAKRMEIGAVVGAVREDAVVRETPEPGDIVILLGGRTGRDGCGGATGSSKAHDENSVLQCGAEVQKGNPPIERKLQRLFRNPEVTRMIRRCNDFGAGGVSVAIGELADGLSIDLDRVPKKYEGLDGTELAISESQERMAVVIRKKDYEAFLAYAKEENLEATYVADVTADARLTMRWRGKTICDISREFLNTNGATKNADVAVELPDETKNYFAKPAVSDVKQQWLSTLGNLNSCSQKGLSERFDSTIGANTVLMPFGGAYQMTPNEAMVAKLPVLTGETDTASAMAYGFDPDLSSYSPFHGAQYAVLESVAKLAATGARVEDMYLTFQEYFEKLGADPKRWGKPFAALLGGFTAQLGFNIAAIGGKDSMSGSFNDLDVPPTLVSFAIAPVKASKVISNELKATDSALFVLTVRRDEYDLPDYEHAKKQYHVLSDLIAAGKVRAASAVRRGGICETLSKMAVGNRIGFTIGDSVDPASLFTPDYGNIVLELASADDAKGLDGFALGTANADGMIRIGAAAFTMDELWSAYESPLEKIYPTRVPAAKEDIPTFSYEAKSLYVCRNKTARPRVFIPVFPGTNCEYDTMRKFRAAGADCDIFVLKNLTPADVTETMQMMAEKIAAAQIIMIPGGFSGGDEPDGSGKFITAAFRNPAVSEAVADLLQKRDGLMLGICNGFQALIKLGLLPYGEIRETLPTDPTLTFNTIGRHVSRIVNTRVASNKSPWLSRVSVGDVHAVAVSHGEGRFIANDEWIKTLADNGQIAFQYTDADGKPSYETEVNPNGSVMAIEGITSPDGRILGKMGHSERAGVNVFKNITGETDQHIFEAGVEYFR